MSGEVVRGEGHAPGQGAGVPMPTVTTPERGSLGDMREHFARMNADAQQQPANGNAARPQTTSSRIGEFSRQLEAKQEAPTGIGEQRQTPANDVIDPELPEGSELPEGDEQQQLAPEESETEQAQAELADAEALTKFREWQNSDLFPDEMADKWLHELKVAGRVQYVDTKELRQGYMRGGDARRMYSEAQQVQQQAQSYTQSMNQHFQAVRDPEQMLEIYERNGYGETLEKVARLIAERVSSTRRVVRAAGLAAMEQYGTQDPNDHRVRAAMEATERELKRSRAVDVEQRRLAFERSQFDQSRTQTQTQQETAQHLAQYERQLNQLRPNAFRAYGIKDSASHRQALARHLGNVIATRGFGGDITRELVMEAASDLKEELEDRIAAEQGAGQPGMTPAQQRAAAQSQARQAQGRPLPPGRLGMGGGKPMNGEGAKRGSLRDLEAMVQKSRTGG